MRHPACRAWLPLLLALAAQASAQDTGPSPDPYQCPDAEVTVRAAHPADAADACLGAYDAVSFFLRLGLVAPGEPLRIEIVPEIPIDEGRTAVGCYLERDRRILMLPYAEFAGHETWFGLPVERAMYRSLATHETAHALADCHFGIPDPTLQAKEYVAYVTMFATMEPGLRTRVLRAIPGEGFASEYRISEVFYLCDPMRFGAEAYRHYLKAGHSDAFLRAVLAGRALVDW
jgi:hypothetical protein